MQIKETPTREIYLEWKMEGRDKQRRSKGKHGCKQCYHATQIRIPETLMPLITHDKEYTYIYEYFDKVCMLPEPPKNHDSTKMKLLSTVKLPTASMEVPAKIFDTASMDYAIARYYPNKKDYATNRQGVVELDVGGDNRRKFLKRSIDENTKEIRYTEHVQISNVPEGIHLHKDLIKILDPEHLYIYYLNGTFYLTDIQPTVECIETNEADFKETLWNFGLIEDGCEIINLVLHTTELDPSNKKKPMISIEILGPRDQ